MKGKTDSREGDGEKSFDVHPLVLVPRADRRLEELQDVALSERKRRGGEEVERSTGQECSLKIE